jgi:hypothetical protein
MCHPVRLVTAEELFALPDSRYRELVRGVPRVFEVPGGLHGWIAGRLADHVERHGLDSVLVEAGYVLQRAPDTVRGRTSRSSATPACRLNGFPSTSFRRTRPGDRNSVAERPLVRCGGEDRRLLRRGRAARLGGGSRAGRVIVRYPDRPPRIVPPGSTLEGEDVVPGFALALLELFTPRSR